MKRICTHLPAVLLLVLIAVLCCSCGGAGGGTGGSGAAPENIKYEPGKTTVLVPSAGGGETAEAGPLVLDFSNASQGYFMGRLTEPGKKVNIQVTGPDEINYKYFLEVSDVDTAFPFTAGNGNYLVLAFESVGDDQYATLLTYSLTVELDSEFLPFLYPNQYVDFTQDSQAIQLAAELSADAESDLDALTAIYQYVTDHITYDDDKAANVETGYLPDIDDTLKTGTGICFDFAALTTAMLRSLSIPSRLSIGYSGDVRHAWIDVYIESVGWVRNAVRFTGNEWKLMDPTFASVLGADQNLSDFIGDGENYTLQYIR